MTWQRLLSTLDDLANPLLVREVYRTMRSRIFAAGFLGTLVLFLVISLFSVDARDLQRDLDKGADVFSFFLWIFALIAWLGIPFYGARWIWEERRDDTFPILSITTLGPWRMVTGRLQAGVVQLLTMLAVMAPFATFSYLLRGLDLVAVLLATLAVVMLSVLFLLAGIFLSTLPSNRSASAGMMVLFLMGLLFVSFWLLGSFQFLTRSGLRVGLELEILLAGLASIVPLYLVLTLAARASLAPPTTNYSMPVRMSVLGTIVFWFCAVLYAASFSGGRLDDEAVLLWSVPSYFLVACLGLGMIGEPVRLSARLRLQAARFVRGRIRFQLFLAMFFTGSGTGFLCLVCLLALVSMAHFILLMSTPRSIDPEVLWSIPIISCYTIIYAGLTLFISRHLLPHSLRTARNIRSMPFLIGGLGCIVSAIAYIAFDRIDSRGILLTDLLNPFLIVAKIDSDRGISPWLALLFVFGSTVGAVLLNIDHLLGGVWQVVSARPPRPAAAVPATAATDEDAA